MKKIRFLAKYFFLFIITSCGICFPSNLEFKNIKYFNKADFRNLDLSATYRETNSYEATRDLKKIINQSSITDISNRELKFTSDGFVYADLWSANDKKQQGIIYSKNGNLFIDKIGSSQDRCKFIETYRVKIEGEKIILIQYGGITNQKNVFEFTKIEGL